MEKKLRGNEVTNQIEGFFEFLRRWDNRAEFNRKDVIFNTATEGNINFDGTAKCFDSYLLTRWHPSFSSSIESGVRELVIELVNGWNCITYSSCEGHRSTDLELMRIRHVRLIARNKEEYRDITKKAFQLKEIVNRKSNSNWVLLDCRQTSLQIDDGVKAPSIDLIFEGKLHHEESYWENLEDVYRLTVAVLKNGTI